MTGSHVLDTKGREISITCPPEQDIQELCLFTKSSLVIGPVLGMGHNTFAALAAMRRILRRLKLRLKPGKAPTASLVYLKNLERILKKSSRHSLAVNTSNHFF